VTFPSNFFFTSPFGCIILARWRKVKREGFMATRAQAKKNKKASFITGSKKSGRKAPGKDTVIGLSFIGTEKNILIQNIKKGLPISVFEKIQKELDVSADTLASAVNIANRTLTRRKKEGRFQPDESERVLRIASLFDRALQVLHRHSRVQLWFKSPQKGLGGKTPLEYADTEPGAREVEDLLGRLEHGVFS
jgi:putative toxin-antitoxin system antitoxin component (TIGR02293 family)